MLRKFKKTKLIKSSILIFLCVFFCEYLIFLIYISKCNWSANSDQFKLKAIALSDTHLFGLKRGHFLDKLKREWSMYICFQLAIYFFEPNSVFFLGDLFDEGLIADNKQFKKYSSRFFELFPTKKDINLIVSVGNHDVGFHDRMVYYDPFFRGRFENVFNTSLIEFKILNGINVVNVNSMAMKRDNCELCSSAEYLIDEISKKLFKKCADNQTDKRKSIKLCEKQRPILMSHFPLFRKSDLDCDESDSNYNLNEKINIKPNLGCLSEISTNFLLKKLQPRLSLNGHTHYGCIKKHKIKLIDSINDADDLLVHEYTLSSFNFRNRPNPSFLLLLANPTEFQISRCMMPNENYLILIYFLVILYIFKILFINR